MRSPLSLGLVAGLVVALAACDAAGPAPPTSDAKPSGVAALASADARGNSSEHRQEKVAVCHYDDETDSYELLSVGAPALSAHLERHPDGVPGGEVPEAEVPSAFGDDCAVVPLKFTCDVEYGADDLGRRTVRVTTTATDPTTVYSLSGFATVFFGEDEVQQTALGVFYDRLDNPASVSFLFTATTSPNDDLVSLGMSPLFPDGSTEEYVCGPYPVHPPDPG